MEYAARGDARLGRGRHLSLELIDVDASIKHDRISGLGEVFQEHQLLVRSSGKRARSARGACCAQDLADIQV